MKPKPFAGTGRTVLMDDEENVRQTTGDVLMRLGHTVEFADDGLRAVDLYQKARKAGTPFTAVIMDLTICFRCIPEALITIDR